MKKFFVLVAALALAVPAMASTKINWNGQFDVLGFSVDKPGFEEGYSNTYSRLILGANFGLAENVEGNARMSYFSAWGDNYLAGQQLDNTGETGVLNNVRLIEANVVVKNLFDNDRLSVKIGRQFYDGGTLFYIGPRDLIWDYFALSQGASYMYMQEGGMDGAVLTYDDQEKLKVEVGYSKIVNEDTPSGYKINLSFVNAKYNFSDMLKVQGYVYDTEMADVGPDYLRFEYVGVKPEITMGQLEASAELIQCFGDDDGSVFSTRHTKDGYRAKLEASYDMDPLKVRGMYFMTGSEFFASPLQHNYFGLYFTSISRMISMSGVPDVVYMDCINFGADYTINKFKFSLDYFRVGFPRDDNDKMYEIDLVANYNYKENVVFKAAAGCVGQENDGSSRYPIYFMGMSYKFGGK